MSYEEALTTISVEASTDLSDHQYQLVSINTSGQLIKTGSGARMLGVLQDKPDGVGKVGSVAIAGVTKAVANSALPIGTEAASSADGDVLGASSGHYVLGTVMSQSFALGDVINVLIEKYQKN